MRIATVANEDWEKFYGYNTVLPIGVFSAKEDRTACRGTRSEMDGGSLVLCAVEHLRTGQRRRTHAPPCGMSHPV
jgi:hypothetical protein